MVFFLERGSEERKPVPLATNVERLCAEIMLR